MPAVAVVGASTNPRKYGNKAVRAYLRQGWTVYPVNPNEPEIEGLKSFASLAEVPVPLDRVTLYVPAAVGLGVLPEVKAKGLQEVWVNPGAESDELITLAESLGLDAIQACSIVDIGERP